MTKDIDAQFLCKDCERYDLCEYYHNRKKESYICKYFHLDLSNTLDKIRAEINAIEISGLIDEHTLYARSADGVKNMVLEIIDRYRNEVNE